MDIWAWFTRRIEQFDEADSELARQLIKLPSWAVDNDHPRVDAVVGPLLADVNRLNEPWLEVFVRHWRLQSLVLSRMDVRRGLPEAVDLVERAHRDDAIGCPQSVCVTQDLCAAYGHKDGPGYARERLQVSEETLGRIDPTWPCWTCITGEHANALTDAGRPDEALAFCASQLEAMRAAGASTESGDLAFTRADALISLERYTEARDLLLEAQHDGWGEGGELTRRVFLARAYAALENFDEAENVLPTADEIEIRPVCWESWCRAWFSLVAHGGRGFHPNLRSAMLGMSQTLAERHAFWDAAQIAGRVVGLEMGCGNPALARAALKLSEEFAAQVSSVSRERLHLDMIRTQLESLPLPEVPSRRREAEAVWADEPSLATVVALSAQFPDWWEVADALGRVWFESGHPNEATEVYERALSHGASDAFVPLASVLTHHRRYDQLGLLLDAHPEVEPAARAFFRSVVAEAQGDLQGALDALDVPTADDAVDQRRVDLLQRTGRNADALKQLDHMVAVREPGNLDWERIRIATRIGEWDAVRHSGRRLGMEFDDEDGPVEEAWGPILVEYPDERMVIALRTGPVTARVLPVMGDDERERHNELVMFNPVPQEDDPDEAEVLTFSVTDVLEPSDWTGYSVRGVYPGEASADMLSNSLRLRGFATWTWTREDSRLPSGDRMLYMAVGVPPSGDAAALHDALKELAPPGLVWTTLAQKCGTAAEFERQRTEAVERLGLQV